MLPEMTMTKNTATDGADAPEYEDNVERAISIVLEADEKQMEKILGILFNEEQK